MLRCKYSSKFHVLLKAALPQKSTIFMKKIYLLIFIFLVLVTKPYAQDKTLDSLWRVYNTLSAEKEKIDILLDIAYLYRLNNPDSTILLAREAIKRSQDISFDKGIAWGYNRLGVGYLVLGKLPIVLDNLQKAERIFSKIDDEMGLASTYLQRGTFHSAEKEYDKALIDYKKALELYQKIDDKDYIMRALNNMGTSYYYQKNYQDALIYYQKALHVKGITIKPLLRAILKNNIGLCQVGGEEYDLGTQSLLDAREIFKELNDIKNLSENTYWIAFAYAQDKNYPQAQLYGLEALELSQKAQNTITTNRIAKLLVEIFKKQQDFERALLYAELYEETNDTLYSAEKANLIANLEANAELEKKDLEISNQKEINYFQKLTNYLVLFFLIIALLLVYTFYKSRLKETKSKLLLSQQNEKILSQSEELRSTNEKLHTSQKAVLAQNVELQQQSKELLSQKEQLEQLVRELGQAYKKIKSNKHMLLRSMDELQQKKAEISQQNKRIQQSMKAGLTIQQAILPETAALKNVFSDHFVLYLPKDTVSGDFYWVEETPDQVFMAVVDCTGHGVPGAFMSMIGNTLLERIVVIQGLHSPEHILESLHQEIFKSLKQDKNDNNYGMDVALLVMDKKKNEGQKTKIRFSGAKIPLHYLRAQDKTLQTIKGARKAIGGQQPPNKQFSSSQLWLEAGDMLYLGSDGLADQNDQNRKKFGIQKIKTILEKHAGLELACQKKALQESLLQHQGDSDQRDDILMIGIKI